MSKPAKPDPASDPLVPLFKSLGLTQAKAAEAAKSPRNAVVLKDLIETHSLLTVGLDEKQASLIVALAGAIAKSEGLGQAEQAYAIKAITDGRLKSVDQVTSMSEFSYYA